MVPKKSIKGMFNKVVIAGLLAGSGLLATGVPAGAHHDGTANAGLDFGQTAASSVWQNDPQYSREMTQLKEAYDRNYQSAMKRLEAREKGCVSNFMSGQTFTLDFGSMSRNAQCRADAAADREATLGQLQDRLRFEQNAITQRYEAKSDAYRMNQKQEIMQHQQSTRVTAPGAPTYEQQELKVCQDRKLQHLSQGKNLPADDACHKILTPGPK